MSSKQAHSRPRAPKAHPRDGIPTPKEVGERIFSARLEASAEERERIAQDRLGALVGGYLGKESAVTAATVSRWEAGLAMPSIASIAAVAAVCGVDPGWLAFGSASKAPGPRDAITDSEVAKWRAASVGLMAEKEAHERIVADSRKWSRHWNARFNKLTKARPGIARIRDAQEREEKTRQWGKAFDDLTAELNQQIAERTRRFREAGELVWRDPGPSGGR